MLHARSADTEMRHGLAVDRGKMCAPRLDFFEIIHASFDYSSFRSCVDDLRFSGTVGIIPVRFLNTLEPEKETNG